MTVIHQFGVRHTKDSHYSGEAWAVVRVAPHAQLSLDWQGAQEGYYSSAGNWFTWVSLKMEIWDGAQPSGTRLAIWHHNEHRSSTDYHAWTDPKSWTNGPVDRFVTIRLWDTTKQTLGGYHQVNVTGHTDFPCVTHSESFGDNPSFVGQCPCIGATPASVNSSTGNEHFRLPGVEVAGRGPGLNFDLGYNSLDAAYDGPIGHGWRHSYDMVLRAEPDGSRTVVQETGSTVGFKSDGAGGWVAPGRMNARLSESANGTWIFGRNHLEFFTFDIAGKLVAVGDRNGHNTTLTYAADGPLDFVEDEAGRRLDFTWANGRLESITDPRAAEDGGPRLISFDYDTSGNLTSYGDIGGGTWVMTYDAGHRLTTARPPRHSDPTKAYEWHYDVEGRVDWEEDPQNRRTELHYDDPVSGATRLVEPDGDQRVDYYNLLGQRTKVTYGYGTAEATSTEYVYDPHTFMVTKMIDGNGKQWLYGYDDPSNPHLRTSTTDPLNRMTSTTYNAFGQVLTTTDAEGVTTQFAYDSAGNVEEAIAALGTPLEAVTDLVRGDPNHPDDVTATIDPRGHAWTATFDPATGDRWSSTDPEGNTTTYAYNSVGWTTATVAPAGNAVGATPADFRTAYVHDDYGRVLSTTNPEGETSTTSYDPNGNVEWVEDNDGERTTYTYNDADEMIVEQRPDTTQVLYDYWPDGTLKSRTDPAGNIWSYAYDALDRVVTSTDPLLRATSYSYDGVGNRTQTQQPDGDCAAGTGCVSYTYDAANQLELIDYSDPATVDVSFTYDDNGRRRTMTDGTGTSTSVLDDLGRLDLHTDGLGQTVDYSYDPTGNVTGILYPGQSIPVTRAYDAAGRLESVTDWLGNTSNFDWDPNTNLESITFPTKTGNVDTFSYDRGDRLTGVDWAGHSGTYASETYGRQPDGLLSSITETGLPDGPAAFDYDELDQLTGLDGSPDAYGYDPADNLNRLPDGGTQAFDAASQLSYTQQPISVVGTAKAFNNTTATMNLGLPGGIQTDDQIMLFITVRSGRSISSDPPGYTYVTQRSASEGAKIYVFRRTATGGENNASVSFSDLGTYPKTLMAVVYRGVDPEAPVDDFTSTETGAPSNNLTLGSITATRPGAQLVIVEGTNGNILPQTFTQPAGMANRVDQSNQLSTTSAVGDQTLADAGPTGSRTATYSSSDVKLTGIMLALKPARTTFAYDTRGNRQTSTSPHSITTTYAYDQADRLVDINGTTSYAYDNDGLRVATTTPTGTTAFSWDRATGIPLMLTETPVDNQGQALTDQATAYVYGPGGRVLTRIDPRPDISHIGTNAVSDTGTRASLTVPVPSGRSADDQILLAVTHSNNTTATTPAGYVSVGTWNGPSSVMRLWRRTSAGTENNVTVNFSNLVSVKAATLAVYRGVDPDNPVVEHGAGTKQGTSVTVPSLTASDTGDRLVAFAGATSLIPGTNTWTDPPGMTRRAYTSNGTASAVAADETLVAAGATGTRTFGYSDNGSLIAAGVVLRRLPTPERWHHADHLGSTRALTDETGTTVGTATYEPYGAIGRSTGETSRLGFAGEYTDPTTGLIYLRARWYDPSTGQFLTRDPMVEQTHEPYGYAGNNPTNMTDPTGLCWGPGCWVEDGIDTIGDALPDCPFGKNPNGSCRGSDPTNVVHAINTGSGWLAGGAGVCAGAATATGIGLPLGVVCGGVATGAGATYLGTGIALWATGNKSGASLGADALLEATGAGFAALGSRLGGPVIRGCGEAVQELWDDLGRVTRGFAGGAQSAVGGLSILVPDPPG